MEEGQEGPAGNHDAHPEHNPDQVQRRSIAAEPRSQPSAAHPDAPRPGQSHKISRSSGAGMHNALKDRPILMEK